MGQNAGPENPRPVISIDPSDVAHHLRVAADKYHENARILLEDMNEAIQALPVDQKPAYRQTREALAGLFDNQASDALRLAHLFDDIERCELNAALASIESGNARKAAQESIAQRVCDRLFAGKVNRPAEPAKFSRDAGHNELVMAIDAAGPKNCPAIPDDCGVPTSDHAACKNDGSLQHTPTTWIGNEQVNRPIGGGA